MSALLAVLGPVLKVLLSTLLPMFFELREKSYEAVEVAPDPAADADFWAGEWVS